MDLSRLGKRSFVSQRALAEVLADLRDAEQLPSACSRQSIKRSRVAAIGDSTPFGALVKHWDVETKSDGTKAVAYICPAAMLYLSASKCEGWSKTLKWLITAKASTPSAPLRIIIYGDEISPGNCLKQENRRKLFAFYWSIADSHL